MPNNLTTKFKFDDRDGAKVDALRGKLEDLNDLLNRTAANKSFGLNPTFGGGSNLTAPSSKPVDTELAKAKASIAAFEKDRVLLNKSSLAEIERGEKALTRIKIAEVKAQNEAAIREIKERERAERLGGRSSTSGQSILFGAAILGGAFAAGVKTAIDKSNEATRANRLLASSATEAGIAYEVLAEKNRKVAETFGLSNVAAAQVTAKIQQLATFTGNPAQFDVLQKRFADLAAAKGIDSSDLNVLIGTILSGQDEGLNRLGISDPGQLYKAYAKEIGKTADTLTQFEKVQAAVNAVTSKGAIFDGSAEARMNSLEGATAKAAASYDNLTTSLSQTVTNNIFFQNSLDLINKGLLQMSFNIDEVRKKLKNGLTPEDIAREEMRGFGNQLLGGATVAGNLFAGLPFLAYDLYDKPIGEAFDYYRNGIDPARFMPMLVKQRADQIRNQQKLDSNQETDAKQENQKAVQRNLISSFQSRIDALLKPASDGVSKAKIAVEDLNALEKDFSKTINTFGAKENVLRSLGFGKFTDKLGINSQTEKLREGLETVRRKFLSERAEAAEKQFSRNPTLEDARFNLNALNSIQKSLPEEQFERFSDKLQEFIKNDLEKSNDKIKEIGKNANSIFDGLNQKLNANNPVALAIAEGRRELKQLESDLKNLSPELQKQAIEIQKYLTDNAIFNARLDRDFAAFDLNERAEKLRKFKQPKIDDTDKFFKDFMGDALKQTIAANGGSNIRYNSNIFTDSNGKQFTTGFTQTDLRDEIFTVFERTGGFQESSGGFGFGNNIGGFYRREKTFADLTEKEKYDFINKENLSLQDRLSRSFDLASNRNILNDEQQSAVDRRILALSSGMRPEQFSDRQRDIIATAAENEAKRKSDIDDKGLKFQEKIEGHLSKLREIAEKEGFKGFEVILKNEMTDGTKATQSAPRATPADTAAGYSPTSVSDRSRLDSNGRGKLTNR